VAQGLLVSVISSLFGLLFGSKAIGPVARIFFGIGNPGPQYIDTRHNVGFMAIDRLARSLKTSAKFPLSAAGDVEAGLLEDLRCALVKPLTYVNRSGEALRSVVEKTQCPLNSCLVVVDDYHLPLGTIRLRRAGSDGGHNGLKSIIGAVGRDFPRLRIGIGPVPGSVGAIEFVLGKFEEKESPLLEDSLTRSVEAMKVFAAGGIDAAMSAFNK
jgi:PTH1 family peptidyl-tRNA hydrolase